MNDGYAAIPPDERLRTLVDERLSERGVAQAVAGHYEEGGSRKPATHKPRNGFRCHGEVSVPVSLYNAKVISHLIADPLRATILVRSREGH
jgi:hypothetical protein